MYPDNRPDPQELLNKLHSEKEKTCKGALKIFLGASAGVGKTYAMLKAAAQLKSDGTDVVIGYVETHGRSETEELLPINIEYIPLKSIDYKGSILKEFDIDKALERKPQVIIVDELAHTNTVGSRNSKRYQDIAELLNAGIDVYTALNVQHIESLKNIVEQITEIKINETVPDQVVEDADEVVLIDLPPEELIERLTEGKIYPRERVESALSNFFRKGNLTALRELSLRKTAQKVDQQVTEYRNQESISQVWASNDKLLLVLKPGFSSQKLVRYGKNVFDKGFSEWYVGYTESPDFASKSKKEKEDTLSQLDLAVQLGATVIQLVGSDPALAIANCVRAYNINTVMLSQHKQPLYKFFSKNLVEHLSELVPGVNINLISDETPLQYDKAHKDINYPKLAKKIAYFFSIFAFLGIVLHPLINLIARENILMIYLLLMVVTNRGRGKVSAVIAAFMGTLSFDFFITPPYFSFAISDIQYTITFLVLAIIGITFSIINGSLRFQVAKLTKLHQRGDMFNEISRNFAGAMLESQVLEIIPNYFREMFASRFMLFLPDLNEQLEFKIGEKLSHYDESIAAWVFNNNQNAGMNTATFSGNNLFYAPLSSKLRPRGVIIIEPKDPLEFFLPEIQLALSNFLEQVAITIERIYFTQVAIQTQVEISKQQPVNSMSQA